MFAVALLLLAMFQWSPPSREMPVMPALSELDGEWRGSIGRWFAGVGVGLDAIRAVGEGAGERPRLVRFMGGVRPVAQWTDRNGNGRADMIAIFGGGALTHQLIDADYDGGADVLRVYDASGALARETRY